VIFAMEMEEQQSSETGIEEEYSASETYQEEITETESENSASESDTSANTSSSTTNTKAENSGAPYYYNGNFWGNDAFTLAKYLIYACLRWDTDIFGTRG